MNLFEKNLKALRQRDAGLAKRVEETEPDGSFALSDDSLDVTLDGGAGFRFGREVSGGLTALVGGPASGFGRFILLAGIGSGEVLSSVLGQAHGHSRVLVMEPSIQLLSELLRKEDISSAIADRRLRISVGDNPLRRLYEECEEWFGPAERPDIKVIKSGSSISCFPEWHRHLAASVEELSRPIGRGVGSAAISALWQKNILKNMEGILSSGRGASLYGSLSGRPGVVVTDSPLLEREAVWLKLLSGSVFIVAEYAALARLERSGVRPDMVLATDSHMRNLRHMGSQRHTLAASIDCHPLTIQTHTGPLVMTGSPDPLARWLESGGGRFGLSGLGNDADAALRFTASLGCSPILLAGDGGRYSAPLKDFIELFASRPDGPNGCPLRWIDCTDKGVGSGVTERKSLREAAGILSGGEPLPETVLPEPPHGRELALRLERLGADAGRVRYLSMNGIQTARKGERIATLGGMAEGHLERCETILAEATAYSDFMEVARFRLTEVYERLRRIEESDLDGSAKEAACYLAIFRMLSKVAGGIERGIREAAIAKQAEKAAV